MSLTRERVDVVISNAETLCSLLNVADEQHFLEGCMTPELFQECIAGDTNRTRVLTLCEKMIHEIWTGHTKMYDALSEYFLRRSEAYKCMHKRFSAFGSNSSGSTSIDAESELLHLQESVRDLTQELLLWRQSHPSDDFQSELTDMREIITVGEDTFSNDTRELGHIKMEAEDERSQISQYRTDVQLCVKMEAASPDRSNENELVSFVTNEEEKIKTEATYEHNNGLNVSTNINQHAYACVDCGKTFRWMSVLLQHVRQHTGEKPFVCAYCGMMFRQKAHLVRHIRIHTGEKPFVCELCGKPFSRKDDLLIHVRSHAGRKWIACEHCGKEFASKPGLSNHVRTKHSGHTQGNSIRDGSSSIQ